MIRVIAGRWKGRRLLVPEGRATRPTSDRARQALFDMLLHAPFAGRALIEGARVLDAFAGTGALGIEALSRGAAEAVFIERDAAALAALRGNVAALRLDQRPHSPTPSARGSSASRPHPSPAQARERGIPLAPHRPLSRARAGEGQGEGGATRARCQ